MTYLNGKSDLLFILGLVGMCFMFYGATCLLYMNYNPELTETQNFMLNTIEFIMFIVGGFIVDLVFNTNKYLRLLYATNYTIQSYFAIKASKNPRVQRYCRLHRKETILKKCFYEGLVKYDSTFEFRAESSC